MLLFSNPGLIDLRAALTFGVSAKEKDNPIGQFGTGLKYAVACTLRAGGRFVIYRGLDRHELSLGELETRGKTFSIVQLDGEGLGFTTHLGSHWEPWQVFRELACNALDEGGGVRQVGEERCREDHTTICVEGWSELEAQYGMRDGIILPKDRVEPLARSPGWIAIYPRLQPFGDSVYNRGVRAGELEKNSFRWTYNLESGVSLTEDRTFNSTYSRDSVIANGILSLEDEGLLTAILTAPRDTYEGQLNYSYFNTGHVSSTFLNVVEREHVRMDRPFNQSAVTVLKESRGKAWGLKETELGPLEKDAYAGALSLLALMGYQVDPSQVTFVESLGPTTLGLSVRDQDRMFISRLAIDQGMKRLVGTILEEHLHLRHGLDDCCYEMQNYLLDRFVDTAARLHLGRVL